MRARWLARLLLPRMRAYAAAREPSLRIKDGPDKRDYLHRWHVLPRGAWWRPSLYLHNMLGPDKVTLHDHPYWSLSLVLSDGRRVPVVEVLASASGDAGV